MLLEKKRRKIIIEALCWQIEVLLLPLFFIYTFIMHAVKKALLIHTKETQIHRAIEDLKNGF